MSGVQGVIVCGEASESDEEEEFCAAAARGHKGVYQKPGGLPDQRNQTTVPEPKRVQPQQPRPPQQQQQQQQQKKGHNSLLHQKLWEANASMERNICKAVRKPLTTQTNQISGLIASIPAEQTLTLSAHAALSHSASSLSNINIILASLSSNPLACFKSS